MAAPITGKTAFYEALANKQDPLSLADLDFRTVQDIIHARMNSEHARFRAGVTALHLSYGGRWDDDYLNKLQDLEEKKHLIKNRDGNAASYLYFYDAKFEELNKLMYRFHRGLQKVREGLKDSHVSRDIAHKLNQGIGQNAFITGKPGSGKSYTAMSIAIEIAEHTGVPFNIERMIFTPEQFMKVYNNEELTPRGSVIIFDEAGVTYNSKDSMRRDTNLFSKLLMTIRHRGVMVLFTSPDLGNITRDGRKLLHYWFQTRRLDIKAKTCDLQVHTVEINQQSGDILFPFPIFGKIQVSNIKVYKVPDPIAKKYEAIAKKYKDNLALNTELDIISDANSSETIFKSYIKLRESGNKIKEACEELGITTNTGTKLERKRRALEAKMLEKKYK